MTRNDAAQRPENHVIVLFGTTGDLARRKLLPGLFHLYAAGLLPRDYRVIGSAPASFSLTGKNREHLEHVAGHRCAAHSLASERYFAWHRMTI